MAMLPNVRYYALLVETTTNGKKTQKFTIAKAAGYYPPMEQLKGKDGKISMYLMEQSQKGIDAPAYRLQARLRATTEHKGYSLNFTGLKYLFENGKFANFAYGEPMQTKTFSKENLPNPFYEYKADGLLFNVKTNAEATQVVSIELLVLADAKPLIATYCKMLQQGGFEETLQLLRKQANDSITV